MNNLRLYVRAQTLTLVGVVLVWLKVSSSVRTGILTLVYSLFDGLFADALTIALLPVIWLWRELENIDVSVPKWITDISNFVLKTVKPAWSWITSLLNRLEAFYNERYSYVVNIVKAYIPDLTAIITKLGWLWDNRGIIVSMLESGITLWIWSNLPDWVTRTLLWFAQVRDKIVYILSLSIGEFAKFLTNPFQYIYKLFPQDMRDAWTVITDDMRYLLWLFSEGKQIIITFARDPKGYILAYLRDGFLDWLAGVLEENW